RTRWPFRPRWPAMATPPLPAPMMHTDSLGRKKDILTPPWLPTPPGWPQKSHRGSCGGLRKHAEIPSRFPTTLARLADGFGPSGWPYPAGEAARIHPGKLGPPLRAQARIQRTSMPVKVSGIVGASLFYVNGRILTTPGKAWKFVALGGRARGCAHGGRSLRPSWPPLARARAAPPSMAPRLALRPRGHTPWPALWPRHGPAPGARLATCWAAPAGAGAAPPSMAPRLALRPRGHTPWPALWPRHGPARGPWPRGQEAEPRYSEGGSKPKCRQRARTSRKSLRRGG